MKPVKPFLTHFTGASIKAIAVKPVKQTYTRLPHYFHIVRSYCKKRGKRFHWFHFHRGMSLFAGVAEGGFTHRFHLAPRAVLEVVSCG